MSGEAVILSNIVRAAVALLTGDVSIGRVDDNLYYFEIVLDDKSTLCMLYNEEDNTISYAGNVDLTATSDTWPLAVALLFLATQKEEHNDELVKDVFPSMRKSIATNGTISDQDVFVLCDNILARITSKVKRSLDIPTEGIIKKRNVSERNGELLVLLEDLTAMYSGKGGVFETITTNSATSVSNDATASKMFTNHYLLKDEISEEVKSLIPNLSGCIANPSIEDTLDTIKFAAERSNSTCFNIFMVGPSGAGKSFSSAIIADELGLPFYSSVVDDTFNGQTILGSKEIDEKGQTVYKPSWFAKAIQTPCVIEFAEVNAAVATALTSLYDVLDKHKRQLRLGDGTIVKRHPHCIIIFTCNAYGCMNTLAKSLPARCADIIRLEELGRSDIKKILLKQIDIDGLTFDNDIVEKILDCREAIEEVLHNGKQNGVRIPKDCESSMRAYAYWMLKCEIGKQNGRYNPIAAAKKTILPVISSGANFNEEIEKIIIDTIISPIFDFVEG
jgi:hypothetical protein